MNSRLIEQNPWWGLGLEAFDADPKLRDLASAPVRWSPPLSIIDTSRNGVYTVRGQRQVGKSTYLKLLARDHIVRGWAPTSVLYADVEAANATRQGQLAQLIRGYLDDKQTRQAPGTRLLVLLDEVTGIKHWQTAIRVLADAGRLEGVTVVATGSSCKDVKTGGDRLPRRRGQIEHRDIIYQPLSFRDYLTVTAPDLIANVPAFDVPDAFDPSAMYAAAQTLHLRGGELLARFGRYLATGGFLVSIAAELTNQGVIPEYVYTDYRAAILGEVARLGRRELALRPIVQWLHTRLGEEFEWRDMAHEAGGLHHETARDLVEDLQLAYVWHLFYRAKQIGECTPALKSPKRLYPLDPFTWHMLSAWGQGGVPGWTKTLDTLANPTLVGKLTESVVADHIRRLTGSHSYYYRTTSGEEIDFVMCRHGAPCGKLEVKFRNRIHGTHMAALRRHGGGLLLSKDSLFWAEEDAQATPKKGPVAEMPVAYALALWGAPSVFPDRP